MCQLERNLTSLVTDFYQRRCTSARQIVFPYLIENRTDLVRSCTNITHSKLSLRSIHQILSRKDWISNGWWVDNFLKHFLAPSWLENFPAMDDEPKVCLYIQHAWICMISC